MAGPGSITCPTSAAVVQNGGRGKPVYYMDGQTPAIINPANTCSPVFLSRPKIRLTPGLRKLSPTNFTLTQTKPLRRPWQQHTGKTRPLSGKTILGTTGGYASPFLPVTTQLEEEANMGNDQGLAIFTPNWTIDETTKSKMAYLVTDPNDLFDPATGNYRTSVPAGYPNLLNIYPAFRKFSSKQFSYTNQYWLGDIPIIRLGDIYLVAAEAALLYK